LYINYRGLNKVIRKNYFILLLISKILDYLVDLIRFTIILESNVVISRKWYSIHTITTLSI
ncbi:hypothetical protein K469DRAFT_569400, partial [Zopfia rhizophila CBS 207.26]